MHEYRVNEQVFDAPGILLIFILMASSVSVFCFLNGACVNLTVNYSSMCVSV